MTMHTYPLNDLREHETDKGAFCWCRPEYDEEYDLYIHRSDEGEFLPLYTAPPQREWVGLTDEEYFILQMKIKTPMISVGDYIDAMQMVEEKLKEKNGF
jgi:hypothetical protein